MQPIPDVQDRQDGLEEKPVGVIGNLGNFTVYDPFLFPNYVSRRTREQVDAVSLRKLQETGFAIQNLNEAFAYHIAPLRHVQQIWRLLGYSENPGGKVPRYTDKHLTALALGYPNILRKGEVIDPSVYVRVRYPEPVVSTRQTKDGWKSETRRYDQLVSKEQSSAPGEPYFLCRDDVWDKLQDISVPLFITEGELKAASLGLAGYAAIGFGGAMMWGAAAKSGKERLHPALDPKGLRGLNSIPIIGRLIYLVPDIDFVTNVAVRKSFMRLGAALHVAGAQMPRIIVLPVNKSGEQWKGVDDYLLAQCGLSWAGDSLKVEKAAELIQLLIKEHSHVLRFNEARYPATSVVRGADRLYDKLTTESLHLIRVNDGHESSLGWWLYKDDRYTHCNVYQSIGSTNGKFVIGHDLLKDLATASYEEGVDQALAEGDEKPKDRPVDYANRVYSTLETRLPNITNNTLVEPINGSTPTDVFIRMQDGLINVSQFIRTPLAGSWDARATWYAPPNYRWVSTGSIMTGFRHYSSPPECPRFLELLDNAFEGDVERIQCLQKFMAKVFCNPMFMGIQQFLALYGCPGSGKGTITRILSRMVGNHNVVELRAMDPGKYDTGGIPGKRLILFNEVPDDHTTGRFDPGMAKIIQQITGQDRITCEAKNVQPRQYKIDAEIITVSETPPAIPMHGDGFRRRVIFLGMTKPIAKTDHLVEQQIHRELPGIFWWAMQVVPYLDALPAPKIIPTPACCLADLEDVLADVSPIDRFVNECVSLAEPAVFVSTQTVLEKCEEWLYSHHFRGYSRGLSKRLGYAIRTKLKIQSGVKKIGNKPVRGYYGIRLVVTGGY